MKSTPVSWFEIYVQDMKRAKNFYENVFQGELTLLASHDSNDCSGLEMWAYPMSQEGGCAPRALVKMIGYPSGVSTLIYFSCDDCAAEAKRAVANGGKLFKDKMSIGQYGFIALVTDTEGNLIGLHSNK